MKSRSGSVLAVVLVGTMSVGVVAAAVVSLISTQRKLAVAKELQLQANNVAESALDYAYSYVVYDLMANGKNSDTFKPTGTDTYKDITTVLPASLTTYLTSTIAAPTGFTGSTSQIELSDLSIRTLKKTATVRYFVDGNDPANVDHKGKNLWVEESTIPMLARVKAKLGARTYTAYVQKDVADMAVPGFQHAIFYEMQLQVHRGYPILGSVHTNADMIMNAHTGDTAKYNGSVTCHGHFYRGSTIDAGGKGADPYGFTPILADNKGLDFDYTDPSTGEKTVPVGTNSTTLTILSKTKPSVAYEVLDTDFDSRKSGWKTNAITKFGGYLADISHDVPALTLPGGKGYQQDVATTTTVNEFSNLPYALIEPVLPSTHAAKKSRDIQFNNLNANAAIILRIESTKIIVKDTDATPTAEYIKESTFLGDPTAYLVVKAYKYADLTVDPWERDPTVAGNLKPVSLPKGVIGVCNKLAATKISTAAGSEGKFDKYTCDATTYLVSGGLHDARLGRGVHVLTLDVAALKSDMETAYASLTDQADKAFRCSFNVTGDDWKRGVLYVQFPTDTLTETDASAKSVVMDPANPTVQLWGTMDNVTSYPFKYGSAEKRHPNRWDETDNHGRKDRTDKIVPLAPKLRLYPTAFADSDLRKKEWCIPALQVINAKALPNPTGSKGFSIGTNGPLYLVGSYNSDGDISTNTNLTSTSPTAYAQGDTGAVPSMIMSDTLTFLSNDWYGALQLYVQSFFGGSGAAGGKRLVVSGPVEIDACIATGGYPVFEFFAHTLESWVDFYGKTSYPNPIVIKGAMVAEWESEIQHVKQAYGRDKLKDIQVYWSDHGAYGIPAVRFHKRNMDGAEIPGAPYTPIYDQKGFRLMRRNDSKDASIATTLSTAGF